MLELFGVDRRAESVYVTLLRQPAAGLRDIAKTLELSDGEVHDAFKQLARLSLVQPSREHPEMVCPVRPDVSLEYLLTREHAQLLRRQGQLESSRAAVAALIA